MKLFIFSLFLFLAVSVLSPPPVAHAQNPFTTKPENQHVAPKPPINSRLLLKIILWQQVLREKMSDLIRQVKVEKKITPVLILLSSAFAYGVIHSAGPGHGKAVALSYILACKPNLIQGLIFGNIVALTHGFSGIFLVLLVKFIFQTGMSSSLEIMTTLTQRVSFSLIACLGFLIFMKSCLKWIKKKKTPPEPESPRSRQFTHPMLTAVAVGIIPCPGVVMVMLFSISLNLTWLGILLAAVISFGMAATITGIIYTGMTGKAAALMVVSRFGNRLQIIESVIESVSGLLVMGLGLVLLATTL